MSGKSDTRLSRRAILAAGAGVALGTVAGQDSTNQQGDLLGGTMSLDEAFNVAGDLWIGPAAARSDVDPEAGRVYMASDEQTEYYADGNTWTLNGVGSEQQPVPTVHTEVAGINEEGTGEAYIDCGTLG